MAKKSKTQRAKASAKTAAKKAAQDRRSYLLRYLYPYFGRLDRHTASVRDLKFGSIGYEQKMVRLAHLFWL